VEGSFIYNPFYPKAGGEGSVAPAFRILTFSNNASILERGTPPADITFNWSFANGSPTSQSITPLIGTIPNAQRTTVLNGQDISASTTFTLNASDGSVSRTAATQVTFVNPIFYGTVPNNTPHEADILSMDKRIALFNPFRASLNIVDEHSCFASPMTNPIIDIRETVFGLSMFGTYNIINNVPLTMADGLVVPYMILVKAVPEHTVGMSMALDIIF